MTELTLAAARRLWHGILAKMAPRPIEYVPPEKACGRVAAADIYAACPYPPYRKSPFDGYALRTREGALSYTVVATIGAGELYKGPVAPGEAVRLMTGCAVPPDCDAVIMKEKTRLMGDTIILSAAPQAGDNIIPVGEECRRGELLLPCGSYLTGGSISAIVAMGCAAIPVYKDIQVLFMTSGRELGMAGQERHEGQIYNSNAYLFYHLLAREGIANIRFHHVSDAPENLPEEIETVRNLASDADIIISTGGVSVGLFDTMPYIFCQIGAKELYRRIAMRPGSASYGGLIEKKGRVDVPVLGLSGNPSAAFNAFHLVAVPVLRQLRGEIGGEFPTLTCRLKGNLLKENPVDRFIQGNVSIDEGSPVFTPNRVVTSSALLGLRSANGLAMRPKGAPPLKDGDCVSVMVLQRL